MASGQSALRHGAAWLVFSLIAAAVYFAVSDIAWLGAMRIVIKMAAAGFLALYMAPHSRWFAVVLGTAALGDGLIAIDIYLGAAAFIAAHVLAISFYRRRARFAPSFSQKLWALVIFLGTPLLAWLVLPQPTDVIAVLLYAPVLGAMAATAWLSLFSRYRTGLGAVLFVASDLMIFAKAGVMEGSPWPSLMIWPLYYVGQLLITLGIADRVSPHAPEVDRPANR